LGFLAAFLRGLFRFDRVDKGCDWPPPSRLIAEAELGTDAPLTGTILGNWAWLLHERGLVDEAKLRYERALVIQQQTLGRDHPMLAVILYRYAGLLRDIGQPLEARLVTGRAASIRTQQAN